MQFWEFVISILLLLLCGGIVVTMFFNFVYPVFWGAPYAPSKISDINAVLDFAQIKPGEIAADLGSGDGRAVIMMAQRGANAVGYDISPLLIWWSKIKTNFLPKELQKQISFFTRDFWKVDLSKFDVIFLYQLPHVVDKLTSKLEAELKPGARVVCIGFSVKKWTPAKSTDRVFLYTKS